MEAKSLLCPWPWTAQWAADRFLINTSRAVAMTGSVCLNQQVARTRILGVEPCAHSILSSHTSLPLDSDPPCQEQNPGNVSYAELRLGDTCSDNQHRAKPPTLGPRLSRCIRPHPDLGCLHITYTLQHSVLPTKTITRWQTFAALMNTFPFIKESVSPFTT